MSEGKQESLKTKCVQAAFFISWSAGRRRSPGLIAKGDAEDEKSTHPGLWQGVLCLAAQHILKPGGVLSKSYTSKRKSFTKAIQCLSFSAENISSP